ncbi:MAG: flagellar hook capping FlgD N-terminal domain-containing protein, partial [Clostridium sp.]
TGTVESSAGTAAKPAAVDTGPADRLPTAQDTLTEDLGNYLDTKISEKKGKLELSLEPERLGKLTIRLEYEKGKTEVTIFSTSAKTLEILSKEAGHLAQILEEKTGTPTVIYTPEQTENRQNMDQDTGHGRNGRQDQSSARSRMTALPNSKAGTDLEGGLSDMADQITVSSTANPYQAGVYSAGSNSKNTMDVNSFIKLLAAQLSNQDMTSPMDNSEMMSQMTNMAMVQSLTAMTESLNTSAAVTTQTYAGSLIGQEVTVAVTDPDTGAANGVKYGKVILLIYPGRSGYVKVMIPAIRCPVSWE